MFFRANEECAAFAERLGQSREALDELSRSGRLKESVVIQIGDEYPRIRWVAQALRRWLGRGTGWFLWVTEYGIWPSRENHHLIYSLRASYGERRNIFEVLGHEFMSYQGGDLESFLTLAFQFGWGGYLLSIGGPGRAFFSHDGWVRVETHDFIRTELQSDLKQLDQGWEFH